MTLSIAGSEWKSVNVTAAGNTINAPTDKDYIDAKLQAVIEKMNGDIRAHQLKTNARLDKLEETVAHGLQTLDLRMTQAESNFQHELQLLGEEFNAKLAQMESNFHRSQIDVLKWTIGSMVALTAVSVTVTSVLFSFRRRPESIGQKYAGEVRIPAFAGSHCD